MVRPVIAVCLFLVVSVAFVRSAATESVKCESDLCCNEEDIKGPIVVPDHNEQKDGKGDINIDGFTVLSGILGVGQGLRDGSNKTTATINKNFETQNSVLRQALTGMGVGMERTENMTMFGPDSRGYNTGDESTEFGSSVQSGMNAKARTSQKLRDDLDSYYREFDSRQKILERLLAAPSGNEPGNKDTLASDELAATKERAKTVLDPLPALNLAQNLDKGRTAESYKSTRKVKDSRLLIPTAVMSDLIAARAPVMGLEDWSEKMHGNMGGKDDPGRASDGKLSANGLAGTLTDMRFANQDWMAGQDGIHGMTKTGLLREILMSRADKLMEEYRKMLWLDRMAALMAQKQLSQNKELDYVLESARENLFR